MFKRLLLCAIILCVVEYSTAENQFVEKIKSGYRKVKEFVHKHNPFCKHDHNETVTTGPNMDTEEVDAEVTLDSVPSSKDDDEDPKFDVRNRGAEVIDVHRLQAENNNRN